MTTAFDRSLLAVAEADKALATLDAAQTKSIHSAITKSINALNKDLRSKWGNKSGTDLFARDRAILLANDLRDTLNILAPNNPQTRTLLKELETTIKESAAIGDKFAQDSAVGNLSAASSANISTDVAAAAARGAHDMLLSHGAQFASNASVAIQQGIMLGYGVRKTAAMITALGEVTKSRAATIVRTETMRASIDATKKRFAADNINQVIWIATQDRRTCQRCASRAGKIMDADQAVIPIHPNDRCTVIAYKKEWDDAGLIDHDWLENHSKELTGVETKNLNPQREESLLRVAEKERGLKMKEQKTKEESNVKESPAFTSQVESSKELRKAFGNVVKSYDLRLQEEKLKADPNDDWQEKKVRDLRASAPKGVGSGGGELKKGVDLLRLEDNIFIAEALMDSRAKKIVVRTGGEVAAALSYKMHKEYLEVEYLATSPKNYFNNAGGQKGAGTEAIKAAVRQSVAEGRGGAVFLEALAGAETFYEKIGFTRLPDNSKLAAYLLTAEAAQKLIQ